MKTVIYLILFTILPFFAFGQNSKQPLLDKLDVITNEIETHIDK